MPFDPIFFAVAIPVVLLYGIAKGGFAGPLAILGVPFMSFVISPLQAAAILLPTPCVQDLISIYSYRNSFHLKNLQILIPAAILGIFAGYLWFSLLSEQNIKIFLGLIAIIFSLKLFLFFRYFKKGSIFQKGPSGEQSQDLQVLVYMQEDCHLTYICFLKN